MAERNYVDDAAYALSKSHALTGRGYGARRVAQKLRAAGVEEGDGAAALDHAEAEAVVAALRFAERRRIGPFATGDKDREQRSKAIGAMVRAGHDFDLAKAIVDLPAGRAIDADELRDRL
ncbi:RecX family transcriptional regulator [Sphingomonas lutea]